MYNTQSASFSLSGLSSVDLSSISIDDCPEEYDNYDDISYVDEPINENAVNELVSLFEVDYEAVGSTVQPIVDAELEEMSPYELLIETLQGAAQKINYTMKPFSYKIIDVELEDGTIEKQVIVTNNTGEIEANVSGFASNLVQKLIGGLGQAIVDYIVTVYGEQVFVRLLTLYGDNFSNFLSKLSQLGIVNLFKGVGALVTGNPSSFFEKLFGGLASSAIKSPSLIARGVESILERRIAQYLGVSLAEEGNAKAVSELAQEMFEGWGKKHLPDSIFSLLIGGEPAKTIARESWWLNFIEHNSFKWIGGKGLPQSASVVQLGAAYKTATNMSKIFKSSAVSGVFNFVVSTGFSFVRGCMEGGIEGGLDAIKEDFGENLVGATGAIVGEIAGSVIGAVIGTYFGGPIGTYIGSKIGSIVGAIVGDFLGRFVWEKFLKTAIPAAAKAVYEFACEAIEDIKELATQVGSFIAEKAEAAWDAVVEIYEDVKEWVSDRWDEFTDWVDDVAATVVEGWNAFTDWAGDALDDVGEVISEAWDYVASGEILDDIGGVIDYVETGIADAWDYVASGDIIDDVGSIIDSVGHWELWPWNW